MSGGVGGNSEATAAGARVALRLSERQRPGRQRRCRRGVVGRDRGGAFAGRRQHGEGARMPSRERARRVARVESRRRAPGPAPRRAGAPPTRATTVGVLVPDERIARAAEATRARARSGARGHRTDATSRESSSLVRGRYARRRAWRARLSCPERSTRVTMPFPPLQGAVEGKSPARDVVSKFCTRSPTVANVSGRSMLLSYSGHLFDERRRFKR